LQRAALNVLEPRLERGFLPCSYGYRPRRGVRDAVAAIVRLRTLGRTWLLDADIDDCFDSIDHRLLRGFLREEGFDAPTRALLDLWLHSGRVAAAPDRGLAQGMPISPLLCNIYLHRLDRALTRGRWLLVRYADDFVVCCTGPQQAEAAQRAVTQALDRLHLRLEPAKTRITSFAEGFDFLGAHFEGEGVHFLWEDHALALDERTPAWLWRHLAFEY
jgi:retron-type reverse transcriptase